MIEITATQFSQNPSHYQVLAEKEPIVVDNGTKKQVLMDYDEFLNLNQPKQPFVSLYDALFATMSPQLHQTLATMSDDELGD